jgi:hypothetical protein
MERRDEEGGPSANEIVCVKQMKRILFIFSYSYAIESVLSYAIGHISRLNV